MSEVKPLYLTCTASQAQEFNAAHAHGFRSLNELLEVRAKTHGDVCIASFPEQDPGTSVWTPLNLSKLLCLRCPSQVDGRIIPAYASLLTASNVAAAHFEADTSLTRRAREEKGDRIVALLSPSSADFLVTLFVTLRLGYGVLLLA